MPRHLEKAGSRVEGIYTYNPHTTSTGRIIQRAVSHGSIEIAPGYFGVTIQSKHNSQRRLGDFNDSVELRGRKLLNNKVVLIADSEEIEDVAKGMELPVDTITERFEAPLARFMAEVMAINVVIRPEAYDWTLRDFAQPSLKVFFSGPEDTQINSGLAVHEFSRPCKTPIMEMVARFEELGIVYDFEVLKQRFKQSAEKKRGWLAAPYLSGRIALGDTVLLERPLLPDGLVAAFSYE